MKKATFNDSQNSPRIKEPKSPNQKILSSTTIKSTESSKPLHLFGSIQKKVRVIDYSVLAELGKVDHVIFDKTDTLVKKTARVTALSTSHKLYMINTDNIEAMYADVKKNPAMYQKIDDLEDAMRKKEDENYSEKSQEFYNEVKGEYDSEIFEEDTDFNLILKDIEEGPSYLTNMEKMMSSEDIGSLNSKNQPDTMERNYLSPDRMAQTVHKRRRISRLKSSGRFISKFSIQDSRHNSDFNMILSDLAKKEKIFKEKIASTNQVFKDF